MGFLKVLGQTLLIAGIQLYQAATSTHHSDYERGQLAGEGVFTIVESFFDGRILKSIGNWIKGARAADDVGDIITNTDEVGDMVRHIDEFQDAANGTEEAIKNSEDVTRMTSSSDELADNADAAGDLISQSDEATDLANSTDEIAAAMDEIGDANDLPQRQGNMDEISGVPDEANSGTRPISGRGRRNGQRLRNKDFTRLNEILENRFGIEMQVVSESGMDEIPGFIDRNGGVLRMAPGAAASFVYDGNKSRIILREGATLYEVFHEFQHFKHSRELGLTAYRQLGGRGTPGELVKEMYVYNKILENSDLFTLDELTHANDYINSRRFKFGKDPIPLDLPNNFPQLRPEVRPLTILNR